MIEPAQARYIDRKKLEKLLEKLFKRPIAVRVSIPEPHEEPARGQEYHG